MPYALGSDPGVLGTSTDQVGVNGISNNGPAEPCPVSPGRASPFLTVPAPPCLARRVRVKSSSRLSLTEPDLANYARGAPAQIIEFARAAHLQIDGSLHQSACESGDGS